MFKILFKIFLFSMLVSCGPANRPIVSERSQKTKKDENGPGPKTKPVISKPTQTGGQPKDKPQKPVQLSTPNVIKEAPVQLPKKSEEKPEVKQTPEEKQKEEIDKLVDVSKIKNNPNLDDIFDKYTSLSADLKNKLIKESDFLKNLVSNNPMTDKPLIIVNEIVRKNPDKKKDLVILLLEKDVQLNDEEKKLLSNSYLEYGKDILSGQQVERLNQSLLKELSEEQICKIIKMYFDERKQISTNAEFTLYKNEKDKSDFIELIYNKLKEAHKDYMKSAKSQEDKKLLNSLFEKFLLKDEKIINLILNKVSPLNTLFSDLNLFKSIIEYISSDNSLRVNKYSVILRINQVKEFNNISELLVYMYIKANEPLKKELEATIKEIKATETDVRNVVDYINEGNLKYKWKDEKDDYKKLYKVKK